MRGSGSSAPPAIGRNFADRGGPTLQAKHAGAGTSLWEAPPSVHETLRSDGQPLDTESRAFLEPRFAADFSQVRIHADDRAADSARAVDANAYTVGQHLVFGPGQHAPHTNAGRRLVAHELAHVVQQSGQPPVIQRQPSSAAGPAAQKKSRLVRIERYWGSTSARAFFADGTNEEVTFVDTRGLDGASRPEGPLEAVVRLTIDRSPSLSRPRVERASGASGSKVSVATRLSPADRISTLPGRVRGEVSEAFLSDPENQPDPETMEFAADLGERLKDPSGTMRIEMEGQDPATFATMRTVDLWVSDQQSTLDKVGTLYRARFTRLLNDIRQIGVTGRVAAEDLDAQDVELVLAGAAGGQSEFQTFDEFKRRMRFDLRSGRTSIPEEHADNPDFFVRNEYRKAWKSEAASLRKMSRIAEAAELAPFKLLAVSAAAGSGVALLEGGAAWLAGRGVPYALQAKWVGTSLFASGALSHFLGAREEAKAAGMDPDSVLGILNTASTSILRTAGIGEVSENITDTSMLTGMPLNRTGFERFVGVTSGLLNTFGTAYSVMPEAPKGFSAAGESAAAESGAAKAGIKKADTIAGPGPATSALPDQPVTQGTGGRFSQSAELNIPGPHPFFKEPGAMNENIPTPPPQAQAAEIPLARTGTADVAPARFAGEETVQTGTGAGGTKMSGPPQPSSAPRILASEVKNSLREEIDSVKWSNLNRPKTLKELRDLLDETNALEKLEKSGNDVSERLWDIDRRFRELDDKIADELARSNESRIPAPAPTPPKPGEVKNPSIPTANEPSGNFRWIEDEPHMSDYAKKYEEGAAGARSRIASKRGEVPALDWVKPGGTNAQVKFDGIDDAVFVDRKVSASTRPRTQDQALRQSEALRQNGYRGRWEVTDAREKAVAEKMLTKLGITNIDVKIVPPR
jgi:hypothetical protein